MRNLSAIEIAPQKHPVAHWELGLRYGAAYACTFIAIAAAWPKLGVSTGWILLFIAGLGLPLSLWIRHKAQHLLGDLRVRYGFNAVIYLVTLLTSAQFLHSSSFDFSRFNQGLENMLLTMSAAEPVLLLLGIFLIIAVCRCLFILTDKDAQLCVLASFPTLLLLILVQRDLAIVLYFLAWAVMTAILFALDHHAQERHNVCGYIPAVVPGQEVKMSARALIGIIFFSLSCAGGLAYLMSAQESKEPASNNVLLQFLNSRFNSFAPDLGEGNVQSGPEREINFNALPAVPSRTVLWRMSAQSVSRTGQVREVRPTLWRMFTLGFYNGTSWQQRRRSPQFTLPQRRRFVRPMMPLRYNMTQSSQRGQSASSPASARIRQTITPVFSTAGYVPVLPNPQVVVRRSSQGMRSDKLVLHHDNALEVSFLQAEEQMLVESDVPAVADYGNVTPLSQIKTKPSVEQNLRLAKTDSQYYLFLPASVPQRVRELARSVARADEEKGRSDNNWQRALRLASHVQNSAEYTLRPPQMPQDRDAVDFFLFESKRGYCTYFASALAVLCRSQGIPARVVSGFANIEWETDTESGQRVGLARSSNAHAWTEVWIEGRGWMTLDATPPSERGDNARDVGEDIHEMTNLLLLKISNWHQQSIVWLPLLGLTLGGFLVNQTHRRRQLHLANIQNTPTACTSETEFDAALDMASRAAVRQAYERAALQLSQRFRPCQPWETPHDWLQSALKTLNLQNAQPLETLAELYQRTLYSPRPFGQLEQQRAQQALSDLSWKQHKAK